MTPGGPRPLLKMHEKSSADDEWTLSRKEEKEEGEGHFKKEREREREEREEEEEEERAISRESPKFHTFLSFPPSFLPMTEVHLPPSILDRIERARSLSASAVAAAQLQHDGWKEVSERERGKERERERERERQFWK